MIRRVRGRDPEIDRPQPHLSQVSIYPPIPSIYYPRVNADNTWAWDNSTSTFRTINWPVYTQAYATNAQAYAINTTFEWGVNQWYADGTGAVFSDASDAVWTFAAPEPLTQEEADRRLAVTRAAAHKSAIRRKKAIKKGRKLLLEVLTEAQQEEYARTKSFTVCGANGKTYKLRKGGTTHQIDESGLAILSHCIHLPYSYIDEDTLVAVKLLLETDSARFLKIANTSRLAASPLGISVPAIPQEMTDRAEALAGGIEAVNERFRQLSVTATAARDAAARLGRAYEEAGDAIRTTVDVFQARIQNAADYGDYARECEHQIVAEETGGLDLPFTVRQNHAARLLGHIEDIAGVPVAA